MYKAPVAISYDQKDYSDAPGISLNVDYLNLQVIQTCQIYSELRAPIKVPMKMSC